MPEAYERLLLDALEGDASLFARADEVEAAWRFATRFASWKETDRPTYNLRPGLGGRRKSPNGWPSRAGSGSIFARCCIRLVGELSAISNHHSIKPLPMTGG